MPDAPIATPDSTAVRVALWRALHVEVDAPPHVLEDEIGLALAATVRQVAMLAPGATLAMTYILPLEFADPEERPGFEAAMKGARASGTPFISFFTWPEMRTMAREAGFIDVQHVPTAVHIQRYVAGRADGLRPGRSEELLVATT